MNDDITIYVLTVGNNPNFQDCLDALNKQTMSCKIEIIKNVCPISKAIQEMFNRCKTKYSIQCDEDMILYPNAVQMLYDEILKAPAKTAMVCYSLHDVHLQFDLLGIKIYDVEVYKNFPIKQNTFSGSRTQMEEIKKAGYDEILKFTNVGLHSPKWTNELIFLRYYDLMNKYKGGKFWWMRGIPDRLLTIFKENPSELNFNALMGCLSNLFNKEDLPIERDGSKTNEYYKKMQEIFINEWGK